MFLYDPNRNPISDTSEVTLNGTTTGKYVYLFTVEWKTEIEQKIIYCNTGLLYAPTYTLLLQVIWFLFTFIMVHNVYKTGKWG